MTPSGIYATDEFYLKRKYTLIGTSSIFILLTLILIKFPLVANYGFVYECQLTSLFEGNYDINMINNECI